MRSCRLIVKCRTFRCNSFTFLTGVSSKVLFHRYLRLGYYSQLAKGSLGPFVIQVQTCNLDLFPEGYFHPNCL